MTEGTGGPERDGPEPSRKPRTKRPIRQEARVPAWVVIPLATLAGYAVSGVPGGLFGLFVGLVLWWSRR